MYQCKECTLILYKNRCFQICNKGLILTAPSVLNYLKNWHYEFAFLYSTKHKVHKYIPTYICRYHGGSTPETRKHFVCHHPSKNLLTRVRGKNEFICMKKDLNLK